MALTTALRTLKRKVRLNYLKILFVLIPSLLLLVIIGFYLNTGRSASDKHVSSTYHYAPISSIVSSLTSLLEKKFSYLSAATTPNQITVGYQPPDYNFQVILPNSTNTITWTDDKTSNESTAYSNLSSILPSINNYLSEQGFTRGSSNPQDITFLSATYFYSRSNAVCQVNIYTLLDITCTPIKQLDEVAEQSAPLVNIYAEANSDNGTNAITSPIIEPSKVSGYTTAILPIFNSSGETDVYFYKQGNDNWQMVNLNWYNDPHEDGQPMPNCADFESVPAISQAFYGVPCYDSASKTETTII